MRHDVDEIHEELQASQSRFTLSFFGHVRETQPKERQLTWAQICTRFERPVIRKKKDGALFSPAVFRPAYRLQVNVIELSMLMLDYDHHASFESDLSVWQKRKCCFAAYTTHSHQRVTKSNPEAEERFRVVIPLALPIPIEKFPMLWQWAAHMSGGKIDAQAQDASRMYYMPSIVSSDAPYKFLIMDGKTLDWRTLNFDHLHEPETHGNQLSSASAISEFYSWEALHAETVRRIRLSMKARVDRKGWTYAPGICHGSTEGKALYVSPEGAYRCRNGCETATIRAAYKLPERPAAIESDPSISDKTEKMDAELSSLRIVRMADVEAEEVRWLWYPYIALGKLTILEGDPGLGKSWLTCALASAVSCGRGLPGIEPFEAGNVLMLSAEDGKGDTLRPRLDAVGADVQRVFALDEPLTLDEPGLIRLEAAIIEYHPVLVIIDPLFAYTGGTVDIHRANECRAISAPLAAIAERQGCAIVALRHLTKAAGRTAMSAGIGSVDIRAAARSVLLVGADPDDPTRRAIVQTKNNLAMEGRAIGYKIENGQFWWTGESDLTAGRILANATDEDTRGAQTDAMAFLREMLGTKPRPAKEVKADMLQAGFTEQVIRRAREKLGVHVYKEGGYFGGKGQRWMWELRAVEDVQGKDSEHLQPNAIDKNAYSNNLAEDVPFDVLEHLQVHSVSTSADGEPLTVEEAELAARLEFMENIPRAEAERRAREWYAPLPF
jgi:hypothetical protein